MSAEDLMPPQTMEINPSHPIIIGLNKLRNSSSSSDNADGNSSEEQAKLILAQVVDNAMITAGLIDDSRGVVNRVNKLMLALINANTDIQK